MGVPEGSTGWSGVGTVTAAMGTLPGDAVARRPTETDFRPVKVLVVDAERPPGWEGAERPSGGRYGALWMLVRRQGRPAGLAKIPFVDGPLSPRDLAVAMAGILGPLPAAEPVEVAEPAPLLSIVIPTILQRQEPLRRCVESLRALDYPHFEILVVDNRPLGGEVPGWLAATPGLQVLTERRPGISAARNRGLEAAQGTVVAFTDDDVAVDPLWGKALVARLQEHPDEVGVAGLVLPEELETPAQLLLEEYYGGFGPRVFEPVSHRLQTPRRARHPWRRATAVEVDGAGCARRTFSLYAAGTFGPGANMAFRADAVRAGGGFDVHLGVGTPTHGGEDLAMFVRLAWMGHSIGFEPAALVHHTHRRDEASLRRQIEGYGTGFTAMMLALVREDPRHLLAILAVLPRAVVALGRDFASKLAAGSAPGGSAAEPGDTSVAGLARLEMRGMAKGFAAYARSRRMAAQR